MKPLVVIPARKDSKRLQNKNMLSFCGKPLVAHTIDIARSFVEDERICITTDDHDIIAYAKEVGLEVPFVRPQVLASDNSTSHDVLVHALNFYIANGVEVDRVFLLQPTSPFRKLSQLIDANHLYHEGIDMVMSVVESKDSPYFNLLLENEFGFLEKFPNENPNKPIVYKANGSIYVINPNSLLSNDMSTFKNKVKYVMPEIFSIDIDTELDFLLAETIMKKYSL